MNWLAMKNSAAAEEGCIRVTYLQAKMYYKLPIILKYCSLLLDAYNARKNASIIYSGPIGGMENPVALMHPTMVTWALSPDPAAQATLPCMVTPFGGFGSSGIPLSSILKICPVFPVR